MTCADLRPHEGNPFGFIQESYIFLRGYDHHETREADACTMIDWDHIDRLRQEVGADSFTEIVDLFRNEVEEVFTRIRAHGATHTDMHFLKGSAANLGFVEFSKTCQISEHALRAGQENIDLAEIFSSFESACSRFATGLEHRLP